MIASVQIKDAEIFAFIAALVFKLLICKVLFINRKDNRNCKSHRQITAKLQILGMRNFQDTFFLYSFYMGATLALNGLNQSKDAKVI